MVSIVGKEWLKVVGAALFELVWVTGLAHANSFWQWLITVAGILVSFYLLTSAIKKLPIGTVYAIFAGLGSVGSILVGVILFGEHISFVKIIFMTTLIAGILGLKLIESKNDGEEPQLVDNQTASTESHSTHVSPEEPKEVGTGNEEEELSEKTNSFVEVDEELEKIDLANKNTDDDDQLATTEDKPATSIEAEDLKDTQSAKNDGLVEAETPQSKKTDKKTDKEQAQMKTVQENAKEDK